MKAYAITINPENRRVTKILDYVKKNPSVSKADVIRYMSDNGSSTMTTHGIIINLLADGLLIMKKDKPNSQTHKLYFNHEREYNKINESLSEIDCILYELDDNSRIIREKYQEWDETGNCDDDLSSLISLYEWYYEPLLESIETMLRILLFMTYKEIHVEIYSQALYTKIIEIMIKTTEQSRRLSKEIRYLFSTINNLQGLRSLIDNPIDTYYSYNAAEDSTEVVNREFMKPAEIYAEKMGIKLSKFDDFILRMDRLKTKLLPGVKPNKRYVYVKT